MCDCNTYLSYGVNFEFSMTFVKLHKLFERCTYKFYQL